MYGRQIGGRAWKRRSVTKERVGEARPDVRCRRVLGIVRVCGGGPVRLLVEHVFVLGVALDGHGRLGTELALAASPQLVVGEQ